MEKFEIINNDFYLHSLRGLSVSVRHSSTFSKPTGVQNGSCV